MAGGHPVGGILRHQGLTAIALNLAAERGIFAWDTPVARYWPEFGQGGKQSITVRQLFNHQAGWPCSAPLTLAQYCDPQQRLSILWDVGKQSPPRRLPRPTMPSLSVSTPIIF